jgi:fucose 4-O-acetylase-like acetyltransferase
MELKRDPYVDILKGICIISIVIGHTAGWNIPFFNVDTGVFVYTYHIMIFMFVGGFTFKKSNVIESELFIGKRVISTFILFNIYTTTFILLHNFLYKMNLISGSNIYSKTEIFERILNGTIFRFSEDLLGAFWFLPVYLLVILLFTLTMKLIYNGKEKKILYLLGIAFFAVIGLAVNAKGIKFRYDIQTAFLSVPIVFIGYLSKVYWNQFKRFITLWGGIIAALIILLILSLDIGQIELSKEEIINVYMFYPVTLLGMYFCLALAKGINQTKLNRLIAFIGKNSFHIMGLHFLSFKIIDLVVSKILNVTDVEKISKFTNSGYNIKLVYILGGVFTPLLIISLIRFCQKHVLAFLQQKK